MTTTALLDTHTTEVMHAMATLDAVAREHHLQLRTTHIKPAQPGAKRWDPKTEDYTRPVLPELGLFPPDTAEFVRWCRALDVTTIHVERRPSDVCFHATTDRDGLTWRIHGWIPRDDNGRAMPGITVDWTRTSSGRRGNHATIPLTDLVTSLAHRGVRIP
ncbi:hypothetical protein [Amycolatopsis thermophila]|uniref:Uncharacterized protein n=1 Tax=Amycolatopsis thermophila TaxID=206084 RepID=A0ABU0EMR8_9PSEU|nr:hypothetical protein [Amycolatopsis thermophila]MDQ0376571.1 hypothetical protein [Amycolatopsis thermophila]